MEMYLPYAPLLAALGVMLTLSLAVERFLEIGSWFLDQVFLFRQVNLSTLKEELEKEQTAFKEASILDTSSSESFDHREIPPKPETHFAETTLDLLPMSYGNANSITKEFWLNTLGCFIGIVGCKFSNFSIFSFLPFGESGDSLTAFGTVLTGVIIGAGSKPVHFLIRFITERKLSIESSSQVTNYNELLRSNQLTGQAMIPTSESSPALIVSLPQKNLAINAATNSPHIALGSTPLHSNLLGYNPLGSKSLSIEALVGFKLHKGVNSEVIENSHKRTSPIDLIVYHHTAMNSKAPFSEVVKEFERKKWLAGYHAVVFENGAIEILTRWDRRGNHAVGYNFRSLGIAFQGNYETNPKVPFSNVNGRLGSSLAKLPQLHAAARVIALWHHLYGVPLEFPSAVRNKKSVSKTIKGIVPHRHLAYKACPGESFQFDMFQKTIIDYATTWKSLEGFSAALENFKTQAYL